jgi:hypothetical protein
VATFDIGQSDEIARHLQDGARRGVRKGLLSAAYRLLGVIQNEIIPAEKPPPIGVAGAYRAAWHPEETESGVDLVNDMPYAPVIEWGARAANIKIGRQMIDALAEWARIKGLTGHAPNKRGSSEARLDARKIAWAIARSMQGYGDKPGKGIFNRDDSRGGLRIAEKAAKRAPEVVREEVEREVAAEMGK